MADDNVLEIGTTGKVDRGMRKGLPDHIDGIPVPNAVQVWHQPRWYSRMAEPLPMVELRDADDAKDVAARWPEPYPQHTLEARRG